MATDDIHVYPVGDVIQHEVDGAECPCGPETEAVKRDDGSYGYLIIHHSMDGREFSERDYAGPPMPSERI